ncbi:WD40/YVTN/BNR-like repeat-containing protein [Chloroflexota bacterium]
MKKRISKILGIGLSAGLLFGLIGAVFAAPVSADLMEWGIVNTPSWEDLQILPSSDILDYDIGGDGDIIYAVLESNFDCNGVGDEGATAAAGDDLNYALVKSTDGGVTWSDITANVTGAANLPAGGFTSLVAVAVAPDDEDWLAVAGYGPAVSWVVASQDGGDNFSYTGAITDTVSLITIYDLAVSIEVDDIHNIAIAGQDNAGNPALFRLKAGTWLSAAWEDTTDTTDYLGWDDGTVATGLVVAIAFSPNFDLDDTIVILCYDSAATFVAYIQSGIWESSGGSWNANAGFPNATEIKSNGDTLAVGVYPRCMGIALPADYDGSDPGARAVFLYVNATNTTTGLYGGYVLRADNNSLSPVVSPPGDPVLASIDVHGDADTGKLMIGEYIRVDNDIIGAPPWVYADPCNSVRVWHTEEIDICCVQWEQACKDPSGWYMALVMYTPDGAKQYASTSGSIYSGFLETRVNTGTPLDESAFSVSRDDAVSFNQLSLIDTDIDYLSDVAVCPDCSTIYLSTVNGYIADTEVYFGAHPCIGDSCETDSVDGYNNCDSVWRSYDDGDTWERVFHGEWNGTPLLRLPCDAVEDCCDQDSVAPSGTVYVAIWGTNDIFYSRDCGQCWNDPPATKIPIQDVAVESENIVYVIDAASNFSMSTQYGRRWSDSVDMGLDSSWTITACCNEGFIVVGPAGSNDAVAWSDDGGESWNLTDDLPASAIAGLIQVACDPNCPNIVYAAAFVGGIYRTDLTDGSWTDMNAVKSYYTGLAVARTGGTLYASSYLLGIDTDPVPAEDYCLGRRVVDYDDASLNNYRSGVARNLTPCETDCCGTEDWDYLICGLDTEPTDPTEWFMAMPSALRICGCLTTDTNTVLWAIDVESYDVIDGAGDNDGCGGLWSYEDCAAKIGPTLTSPADGSVLDCEPCAGCDAANFTLKWERMCEACSYDIVIMDEDGNTIVEWTDVDITGDPPTLFVDGTMDSTEYFLECGMNYTWKVREANTSCECVHSPWSETWSFTVAVGAADAIQLLAPTKGAMDVPINNIGFSWSSVRNTTSYSFVLSPNANLAGALVSQDQSTTAFNFVGPLDYSKAYYWQIIAWQDGTRLTTSSIGVFNTMAKPVAPQPPVVIEQQPAPVINIPAAQKITPTWIYAIIGIGCALAVVVIVLIVRTRRP